MCVFHGTMRNYVICNSKYSRYQSKHSVQSFWKTSPETFRPNGILSHLYLPHRVLNVVRRLLLKSGSTCQNPDVASFTVKYLTVQALAKCHLEFLYTTGFFQLPCSSLLDPGTVLDCHPLS